MTTPQPATLREQLAPVASRLRESRARVRPISQVLVSLRPTDQRDLFVATVDQVLQWLNRRAGQRLPDEAWQRQSFELGALGAQRTAAVSLREPRYWAARLDDADRSVPLRTWITEIGVGVSNDGSVLFGTRLTCATRGEDVPFDRSVPGFVRGIVGSAPALLDGRPLQQELTLIRDVAGVEALVDLLEDPQRRHGIIVLALPEGSDDPDQTAIDVARLRQQTFAAAHVCVLGGQASFYLSRLVGKEFSVFRQAVRLYRPGFLRWRSNPYDHPLTLPERIANWNDEGPEAYAAWVASQALAITTQAADREEVLPSFDTVRRWASQAQRKAARESGTSNQELLDLADAEIKRLETVQQEQKQTYDGLLAGLEQELEEARAARQEALAQQYALRERIDKMQARLATAGTRTPIPNDLEEFEFWCEEHLSGAVNVVSRALRGVKQSVYEQPGLLYDALLLLRDFFVPMKRNPSADSRDKFESELQRLKLDNSLVGDATRTHADHYTIRYGGRPRVLDWHLKRGDSRERTRCFRLYYFWDDESQCAVVGWLPSHLDNALT
jgi:hypothetical protein